MKGQNVNQQAQVPSFQDALKIFRFIYPSYNHCQNVETPSSEQCLPPSPTLPTLNKGKGEGCFNDLWQ